MSKADDKIRVKSYSKAELSQLYSVSEKIFASWLKKFERDMVKNLGYDKNQKVLTIAQVEFIFVKLGNP